MTDTRNAAPARQRSKVRVAGWSLAAGLLALPFVAMQFGSEVDWSAFDFIVMGALFLAVGGAIEFLVSRSANLSYRIGAALAVVTAFLLIWVNLAVGIIGSETNDANRMYAAVLAILVGGSIVAHFKPAGMARATAATAAAMVVVAVIAVAGNLGPDGPIWPRDTIGVTAILGTMWLAAAGLFHHASKG